MWYLYGLINYYRAQWAALTSVWEALAYYILHTAELTMRLTIYTTVDAFLWGTTEHYSGLKV